MVASWIIFGFQLLVLGIVLSLCWHKPHPENLRMKTVSFFIFSAVYASICVFWCVFIPNVFVLIPITVGATSLVLLVAAVRAALMLRKLGSKDDDKA